MTKSVVQVNIMALIKVLMGLDGLELTYPAYCATKYPKVLGLQAQRGENQENCQYFQKYAKPRPKNY